MKISPLLKRGGIGNQKHSWFAALHSEKLTSLPQRESNNNNDEKVSKEERGKILSANPVAVYTLWGSGDLS